MKIAEIRPRALFHRLHTLYHRLDGGSHLTQPLERALLAIVSFEMLAQVRQELLVGGGAVRGRSDARWGRLVAFGA
jgi:hypothetical protein